MHLDAQALQGAKGLPPKPHDPLGRPVSWVAVVSGPGFWYKGAHYLVDARFVHQKVAQYEAYSRGGTYTSPVIEEHKASNTGNKRIGDVLLLAPWRRPEDGTPVLIAAVGWADPKVPFEIATGQIKYFSPGFGTVEDETGAKWSGVLKELSITAAPHQKELNPHTHILATEGLPMAADDKNLTPPEADTEDKPDPMGALMERIAMLEGRCDAMDADKAALAEGDKPATAPPEDEDPAEEDDQEMSEANTARVTALEAQLAELQATASRAVFDKDFATKVGQTITLSEDQADAWYALGSAGGKSFDTILQSATAPAKGTPPSPGTPATAPPNAGSWSTRMGSGVAMSEAPAKISKQEILARAKAKHPTDAAARKAQYANECKQLGV